MSLGLFRSSGLVHLGWTTTTLQVGMSHFILDMRHPHSDFS